MASPLSFMILARFLPVNPARNHGSAFLTYDQEDSGPERSVLSENFGFAINIFDMIRYDIKVIQLEIHGPVTEN